MLESRGDPQNGNKEKDHAKARSYRHRKKICCKFPIALHISDSTLHFLQCPSGRPPWAEKTASATPPFHPPAAQGFSKEYLSALHLYLILLSDVAPDCSSFITYPTDKVKHFCKKAENFGFIVDFCKGCGRLGQPWAPADKCFAPPIALCIYSHQYRIFTVYNTQTSFLIGNF